jgi:hypothetical protein
VGGHLGRRGPPQQRTDTREQLAEPERLRDVVVRAGVEPFDDVELVGLRGQDEDRNPRMDLAYAAAHVEAVERRKADVDDQQVVVVLDAQTRGLRAVGDRVDGVVLALKRPHQRLADALVVLGKEKPMHSGNAMYAARRCFHPARSRA